MKLLLLISIAYNLALFYLVLDWWIKLIKRIITRIKPFFKSKPEPGSIEFMRLMSEKDENDLNDK